VSRQPKARNQPGASRGSTSLNHQIKTWLTMVERGFPAPTGRLLRVASRPRWAIVKSPVIRKKCLRYINTRQPIFIRFPDDMHPTGA
jgi:hypothetical protein